MKNSVDVAQYFIFDLNIPETENIKKIRSSRSVDVVENMFQIRNLNETFDKDLSVNQSNNNNNKIKI
jgi:hypothetical protein